MSEPQILTFGCRLNTYESEVMRGLAQNQADTIIINTCAVTSEAERQARQAIRKLHRERPTARIVVTGCAAQIAPERYAAMPEVARVLGNAEKLKPESWQSNTPLLVNDIMSVRDTAAHLVTEFKGHARAFVQVQQGCDHRCTFCIIPYGRGNSRSVPVQMVIDQVRLLVAQGYYEVVLTGVDVTSYGQDLPEQPRLGALMRQILDAVPELPRLRLSSLDPVEVDDALFDLIQNEQRFMPHLHISLQAGDDLILKRMKRRHLRQDVIDFCRKCRDLRPEIVFGADIIAGFPTETEEMFLNTLALVTECDLTYLHVFPYSERDGTPAARMPQVAKPIRKDRARRLREAGAAAVARHYARRVGGTAQVVVEDNGIGRSEDFMAVTLDQELPPGTFVNLRIVRAEGEQIYGTILDEVQHA
jgi:threonylcarbamoyladenosine tRNA methylthiotransferase MtaB